MDSGKGYRMNVDLIWTLKDNQNLDKWEMGGMLQKRRRGDIMGYREKTGFASRIITQVVT